MAEYASDPDTVILAGTVRDLGPESLRGTFGVERWYKGSGGASVPIQGGTPTDCGLDLTIGDHLVMVAFVTDGVLHPNSCLPFGDPATPEGQQLAREIVAAVGEGTEPAGTIEPSQDGGIPGGALLGVGLAVVIGLVSAFAFLRRDRPTSPQG
jgi:hypothetical protein